MSCRFAPAKSQSAANVGARNRSAIAAGRVPHHRLPAVLEYHYRLRDLGGADERSFPIARRQHRAMSAELDAAPLHGDRSRNQRREGAGR
jgi:hypothetical protein